MDIGSERDKLEIRISLCAGEIRASVGGLGRLSMAVSQIRNKSSVARQVWTS